MDRYVSPARMSHAGFPFHLSLPHRDHRVLFHSRCLTVLRVVKGDKTCQREEAWGSPPVLERSRTTQGKSLRASKEEHRLIKNTVNIRYHREDPHLKSQTISKDQCTRVVQKSHNHRTGDIHGLPAIDSRVETLTNTPPHPSFSRTLIMFSARTGQELPVG